MSVRELATYFPELGPVIFDLRNKEHTSTNKTLFKNSNTGWYICYDQHGEYNTIKNAYQITLVTGWDIVFYENYRQNKSETTYVNLAKKYENDFRRILKIEQEEISKVILNEIYVLSNMTPEKFKILHEDLHRYRNKYIGHKVIEALQKKQ